MGLAQLTYEETVTMVTIKCCNCGVIFGMDKDFRQRFYDDPDKWFYCPNGHSQHYSGKKLDREAYEKKLREAENKIANITSENFQLGSQLRKKEHDLKRLKNGVCPCCNRSFKGLHAHIKNQHPEYKI